VLTFYYGYHILRLLEILLAGGLKMLDFLGTLTSAADMAVLLVVIGGALSIRSEWRVVFAAVSGAWVALAALSASAGYLTSVTGLLVLFTLPLLVVALLAAFVPAARDALLRIPAPVVIGLNVIRIFGFFLLALFAVGRLGGPFPLFAGIGDILTGLFAIPVARLATRTSLNNPRIIAWNAFGLLDLLVAVGLGITSRNGSPIQLIHAGAGSSAITMLPWALVPLVLVPLFMIGHVLVFAKMRLPATTVLNRGLART
jgi:hypothetical protein